MNFIFGEFEQGDCRVGTDVEIFARLCEFVRFWSCLVSLKNFRTKKRICTALKHFERIEVAFRTKILWRLKCFKDCENFYSIEALRQTDSF